MTKYEIILYWSEEDQAFIAEVPELAGCAADGSTRQEALANAETVIAEWIETYGVDSDFVRVRVRGLPPTADELQFIDRERIKEAQMHEPQKLL